jgi:hypothetical protein
MTLSSGPYAGPIFDTLEWNVYNRTSATTLAVGDFVTFDERGSSADALTERNTGGPWGNVILADTNNIGTATAHPGYGGGVVVDLLDKKDGSTPGAVNSLVRIRVRGMVQAKVATSSDLKFGDRLGATNASVVLTETAAAGLKVYAKAAEEVDTSAAGTLYWVYLEGITGHGCELA